MNPRIIVGVVGGIMVVFGLAGLFYPEPIMHFVGFGYTNPENRPGTLGEVRAVYGGLMLIVGVLTLLAVPDPRGNQGRLMLFGLLFLGLFGGRMFSVFVEGSPGLVGWFSAISELLGGGALIYASQAAPLLPETSGDTTPLVT